jgi:SNF2 family DNA or RNA helicase
MFLYEEFMARSSTRKAMDGGNFMGMMNVLMQLRKVCNHPDLFEPRSVVTPFSMEPLSMSTATCVVNAIQTHSGLERLSSQLILPLWSMGHGLPSHDVASSVDDVFAAQVAKLMTPESIIIEKARAQQSSEPASTPDMDSGLASFLSRIRDLDDQSRLDKAHFVGNVNSWRCHPSIFPYSDRLRGAVLLESLPLDLPLFNEMTATQIAMTPTDLLAMRKSQEQRAEESRGLIDKFVFCVPKAGPTGKPILFSGSAPTPSSIEKELISKTSDAFSKYFLPFQRAKSRLTLCFPDKKLVQFDAGKLQTLATLLRDLKHNGHRVLIFTQMSRMVSCFVPEFAAVVVQLLRLRTFLVSSSSARRFRR